MKNIYRKIVAIVATMALTLSFSITGFAAEVPTATDEASTMATVSQGDVASPNDSYHAGGIYVSSSNWVTIATATNGFGRYVRVKSSCPYLGSYLSIRMLDRSGNEVWSETRAVAAQGTRDFDCGSNVYKIQAKYTYQAGTVYSYPLS